MSFSVEGYRSFYAGVRLVVFQVYDFYRKAYGDKFTAQLARSFVCFFATYLSQKSPPRLLVVTMLTG
ncbi:hypothetical protein NC653_016155 [Populus alba x Populus x berolinensis]|uniref:Uncharacterized protein n=1 Tax=Populus alba x Populus x berolinensis TaxID=444605 RepID=A0AAD6QMB6_9ROSI|nr:hypothetical protein NC653_016155 [Populus alba x Populus x berolinensis]